MDQFILNLYELFKELENGEIFCKMIINILNGTFGHHSVKEDMAFIFPDVETVCCALMSSDADLIIPEKVNNVWWTRFIKHKEKTNETFGIYDAIIQAGRIIVSEMIEDCNLDLELGDSLIGIYVDGIWIKKQIQDLGNKFLDKRKMFNQKFR